MEKDFLEVFLGLEVEKELKYNKYKDRLNEEKMYLYFLCKSLWFMVIILCFFSILLFNTKKINYI